MVGKNLENNFGDFVKKLRTQYNLTRKELCLGICSEKQLERIEKNINTPSIFLLHQLSAKLNIDLNKFYKDFYCYECAEDRENIKRILKYIKELNFYNLYILCNELEKKVSFQNGNTYAHLCYGKAAYEFYICKNYNSAIELCIIGIKEETSLFTLDGIENSIFSDIGYSMINLIASCYKKKNSFKKSENIIFSMLKSIEKFYLSQSNISYYSTSFINKLYQTILCQVANNYYNLGNYNKALEYIDKCINFSFDNDMSRLIASLFQLKYLTLYKLNDYHGARECYNCAKTLYINSNKNEIAKQMEDKAKINFNRIFNIT